MSLFQIKNKIRVAVYIRYSSENQRDGYSVEYQLDECKRYIENNDYELVEVYIDEAVTGKNTDNRKAFFELLADVKKGMYDIVLVYKYSRFARNLMEARLYHHQIEKSGAKLISAMEQIDDTTPEGRMMRNIIMTMDEYYSDNLSTFVQSSMYTAAKKVKYMGGILPYGFSVNEEKEFIENKEEADIVRRIFDLRASGTLPADILKILQADGITSRNNKPFTQQLLSKILRAEKYIGTYKYHVKGYDPIYIKDAFTSIVKKETWNRVQALMDESAAKKNTKGRARRYSYPLTGKIVCGICGEPFTGTSKGKQSNLKYYCCRGRDKLATCDNHSIKKDELEDYVFNHIKRLMLHEAVIDDIASQVFALVDAPNPNIKTDIKELKSKQSKIEKKLENLLDLALESSMPKEILEKKTQELKQEYKIITNQLIQLEFADSKVIGLDDVKDFLFDTLKQLENADDLVKKSIASQFVEEIKINRHDVQIKLTCSPNFLGDKLNKGWALFTLTSERKKNRSGYTELYQ